MGQQTDLRILLNYIDPAACSYQEWCSVGMALKHEGYAVSDWEDWSARDAGRYHRGECARKWDTFRENTAEIVTGGTVFQMAVQGGYSPEYGREIGWDDEITAEGAVISPGWVEGKAVREPGEWHPGAEASRYIETLFEPGEVIGYVTRSRLDGKKGKYIPVSKGVYTKTAGKILEEIAKYGDDLGASLGDYDPDAGAWIRFNPLDGKDVCNKNVTEFRYALVECDDLEIEKQNSIIRELELPVAVLMFSGGKSIHAIVRIDAADYKEYQKRVEYLYEVCAKNGLAVDTQNKNPSRLSRLPGCTRGDRKQFIIDTNIGKASWNEWQEWIEAVNDSLPDVESLLDTWDRMPPLADPLIDGILRRGHKMLIAGPSKAGKSFLQIELAIAIAEGRKWLGRNCRKGSVLYVNLELDRASCLHRFRDVYAALGWQPENLGNLDIWNLRGRAVPMDKLTPKLIRRAAKKDYAAIIIDPIYKVITGDENSAEQMARFCNQFDKICAELDCATVYCHHHSKGAQGGKKSMDRAAGSGVFARDPDAQLDLIELPVPDTLQKAEADKALCRSCRAYLEANYPKGTSELSDDDLLSPKAVMAYCGNTLSEGQMADLGRQIADAQGKAAQKTAWRLEATLREFRGFEPVNVWFDYPVHRMDITGALGDVAPDEGRPSWQKKQKAPEERKKEKNDSLREAFDASDMDGTGRVKLADLTKFMGKTLNTVKKYVDESKEFRRENGLVVRVSKT